MNKIQYKIGAGIIAAALMTASFAPAAFAANITVSGNSKKSDNKVVAKKKNVTAVGQKSKTKANTFVFNVSNTGGNKANGNTGDGNVNVGTGGVTNTTTVHVTGGDNSATISDPCDCDESGDISITDNGKKSDNTVIAEHTNVMLVGQSSNTTVNTAVVNASNTGNNKANDNTGDGDVSVQTGAVSNTTTVTVDGGSNTLNL